MNLTCSGLRRFFGCVWKEMPINKSNAIKGRSFSEVGFWSSKYLEAAHPGNCQKGCEHDNNSKMPVASMKMGVGLVSSLWLVHCHVLLKNPRLGGGCL